MLQIYTFTSSRMNTQEAAAEAAQAANQFIDAYGLDVRGIQVTQTSSGADNCWIDFAVSVTANVSDPEMMRAFYRASVGVEKE